MKMISKSRFNRRLHAVAPSLWRTLFDLLAEVFKHNDATHSYVVHIPFRFVDGIMESWQRYSTPR